MSPSTDETKVGTSSDRVGSPAREARPTPTPSTQQSSGIISSNNSKHKVLAIFLAAIVVQGLVWLLPSSTVTPRNLAAWDVQHFLPNISTTSGIQRLPSFAEIQQSAWCQPSSIRNGNYLGLSNGKNPCSSFDAQYFATQRQAEIDAGIQRIYYINLDKNKERRKLMEEQLNNQTNLSWSGSPLPFKRIAAVVGDEAPSICAPGLRDPGRCRGVQGILKSNLQIMQYENIKVRMRSHFL